MDVLTAEKVSMCPLSDTEPSSDPSCTADGGCGGET